MLLRTDKFPKLPAITIIMMFMAYKRSSNSNGMKGLLRVFYRDGVFYFMTLSGECTIKDNLRVLNSCFLFSPCY